VPIRIQGLSPSLIAKQVNVRLFRFEFLEIMHAALSNEFVAKIFIVIYSCNLGDFVSWAMGLSLERR